jgi:hypothetical protein
VRIPLAGILELAGGALPGGPSPAPTTVSVPDPGDAVLVVTVHGGLVVGGLGDAFVKQVIDTPAGSALADQPAYRAAVGLAGSPNAGQAYLDVPDLITALRPLLSGAAATKFDEEVRPYLQPIAAVAVSTTRRDGLLRSRFVVNVQQSQPPGG